MLSELRKIPNLYVFKKEAAGLRGLPDLIICYRGKFFAWELKRSESAAHANREGHALQLYNLELIRGAGGIGRVVYPENFAECLEELLAA